MVAMRVMQVTIDEVVHVVTMWHSLVTAPGAVLMTRFVAFAFVARRAAVRIFG